MARRKSKVMTEIFKDIDGFEGLYQVSNLGNVKSLNYKRTGKEKILQPSATKDGYLQVTLSKNRKQKPHYIHRLVAQAFISNSNEYPVINHKDENPSNNCVDNLEWCTQHYNNIYNNRHLKVAEKTSISIFCIELNRVFSSIHEASRQTGIHQGNITLCLRRKRKSAGGFHWRYV